MSDLRDGGGGGLSQGPVTPRGNGNGNGNGNSDNGASRTQGAPNPTGSPGGIRGPRDIMRERAAREARRRAEQEAIDMEKVRAAEEEARLLEIQEERRISAEKRAGAAGVSGGARGSGGDQGYRSSGGSNQGGAQRISDNSQRSERDRRSGDRIASGTTRPAADASLQGRGTGGRALGGGETAAPVTTRRPSVPQPQTQAQPAPQPRTSRAGTTGNLQPTSGSTGPTTAQTSDATSSRRATQSAFPHAFERWETLSSHWEGLTSYWIRRLEENSSEINSNPISTQLSRQVTDLSAAGANLFHAVVELQRLRASSERKFQRWFFETRSEQERAQEVQAMLEATLNEERQGRADAIADAVAREAEKSNSDKLVQEMKRELQISKEEARRAWEELGRREQEERERTLNLKEGLPTTVGGVQVVPMMQGVPSRGASLANRPQTRDSPGYTGVTEVLEDPEPAYRPKTQTGPLSDPFTESRPRANQSTAYAPQSYPLAYSSAPAVQPTIQTAHPTISQTMPTPITSTSAEQFYQQSSGLHPTSNTGMSDVASQASQGTYSEGEYEIDAQGQFRRDALGHKIKYQAPERRGTQDSALSYEEGDDAGDLEVSEYDQRYGRVPVSGVEYLSSTLPQAQSGVLTSAPGSEAPASGGYVHSPDRKRPPIPGTQAQYGSGDSQDYEGAGYGEGSSSMGAGVYGTSGSGWDTIQRHHHPTRLSDVLEEDERSRTSASQVSRRD